MKTRGKNLDLRGFLSHNVLFTQLTLTDLGGGYGDSRFCGVPVSLIFFVLFAVNQEP